MEDSPPYQELDYQEDVGLEETAHNFMERIEPDHGLERPEMIDGSDVEPVSIAVEPLNLSGRALELYRHHRKGIKQLGVLGISSFGLGVSARAVFSR